jgi:hypothetical protein
VGTQSTRNPDDPLKALLRERDLETLKKRFLGECLLRLQTLEGQVENYRVRLAFLEKRIEALARFQKELWKRSRYLGKTPF